MYFTRCCSLTLRGIRPRCQKMHYPMRKIFKKWLKTQVFMWYKSIKGVNARMMFALYHNFCERIWPGTGQGQEAPFNSWNSQDYGRGWIPDVSTLLTFLTCLTLLTLSTLDTSPNFHSDSFSWPSFCQGRCQPSTIPHPYWFRLACNDKILLLHQRQFVKWGNQVWRGGNQTW